jgi:DNA-binding MarR family transcriptional regulator
MKRPTSALRSQPTQASERKGRAPWTFLTNHAHVLLCIAKDPTVRMRDVAARVGITERAVQRIVSELEEAGYLHRERNGRQNRYTVRSNLPLRHPIESGCQVSALIKIVLNASRGG